MRFTLKIRTRPDIPERAVRAICGAHRIYRQGTDKTLFVDVPSREEAHLLRANLNSQEGIKAEIVQDGYGPQKTLPPAA